MSERTNKKPVGKRKAPIPKFQSREEEAEFWDTHSLADHWDEFTPVNVKFGKNLSQGITIRLDPDTLKQLRELAQRKGVGPSTLARMWVLEHLQREQPAPAQK